jgi:hypothetical protein
MTTLARMTVPAMLSFSRRREGSAIRALSTGTC